MLRKFCGTEVLKAKDISTIRGITLQQARNWLKTARLKCNLKDDEDFTVLDFAKVTNVSLEKTVEMLNFKYAITTPKTV